MPSQMPSRIPGLKTATALLGLYVVAWISLEGALWRAALMGFGVTAVSLAHLIQRKYAGKPLSGRKWALLSVTLGGLLGAGSALLTLVFMAVKTGLHAHGPEFSPQEVAWALRQLPLWTAAGLLGGVGLALILASKRE